MKILISGFKPFNQENINPSILIANKLKETHKDIEVIELNVEYNNDSNKLLNKIRQSNPNIIILLGQAGGRSKISLEYFALNMQSAPIKDNKGELILNRTINENGNEAYKSTIDLKQIVSDINEEQLAISYHAGTFICNEIYYNALKYIQDNNLNIPCVFIHIPYIKEQIVGKNNVLYLEFDESYKIIEKVLCEIKKSIVM